MENYPSNSHKARDENVVAPEPKKIESVVTGDVIRRKKPLGKRFAETFVGGDANSVMSYVVFDVLVPAAKDMISDAFSQGIDRMLFGESRGTSRRRSSSSTNGSSFVSYNKMASGIARPDPRDRQQVSRKARSNHEFDEIILATRVEADEVISRLHDILDQYEQATVADLYEMVGITPAYTDNKWGWNRGGLQGSQAVRTRDGFLLDLPKPDALE